MICAHSNQPVHIYRPVQACAIGDCIKTDFIASWLKNDKEDFVLSLLDSLLNIKISHNSMA